MASSTLAPPGPTETRTVPAQPGFIKRHPGLTGLVAGQAGYRDLLARPDTGLTTERRMSHVFVMDVSTYPRPLFISDAALNVDPDLVSGIILAKQLEYLADSQGVGIVLGARVRVVLTNRADSPLERMVSCALALQLVRRGIKRKPHV